MKNFFRRFEALHPSGLGRHPDVALAVGVAAILGTLVIPLPASLLDVLLATNIAAGALILVTVLLASRPLALSTFPTLLLITTLFRLSLNVSTTRMILAKGNAGDVVQAFGQFVVQGDLVVGIVVFLVITLVQLLVIGKGAERVAEVGARFTLDAMPGKQMSIDADLRNGAITDEEARDKRADLGRESQFYGAMDGAMKFVKGDAIAGLVITALNLVAGLVLGVLRNDMSLAEAAEVYSILTVGDGLVSQVPALLITLSAGVLTTRVAGNDKKNDLGSSLKAELVSNPKSVAIAAAFAAVIGLVPGLPTVPFLIIASVLGGLAYSLHQRTNPKKRSGAAGSVAGRDASNESFEDKIKKKVEAAKAQKAASDQLAPTVALLGIDLGTTTSKELGFLDGGDDANTELLGTLIPQLRDAIYLDSGVKVPGVRIRTKVSSVAHDGFAITIKEIPIVTGTLDPNRSMVMDSPERIRRLGIEVEPSRHPIHGTPVAMIDTRYAERVREAGFVVWSPAGHVALALAKVVRDHITTFIGFQEVSDLVRRLEKVYPELVKEVVPRLVSIAQLTDILRRLADELVSIRDLKSILEALGECAPFENDGVALTEHVRSALSLQIAHAHGGVSTKLGVLLLDPEIEDAMRSAIFQKNNTSYLALDPELRRAILNAICVAIRPVVEAGVRPIVLASPDVRRYLRKLVETRLSLVSVLSFQELPSQLTVQPLGRITMMEELQAAA